MNKKILQSLIGTATGLAMLLSPLGAYAAPATGTNITSQTIPVVATIDTYYEISTPANLDMGGNLNLTRAYNAYVTSNGDTNGTFYGYTTVGIKGVVGSGKKVSCAFSCAPLTRTDAGAATPTPETSNVGMRALTSAEAAKVTAIWAGNGSESNSVAFGANTWASSTGSSPAVTIDFVSSDVNQSTDTNKYAMLRTTLETDGTYEGNLVIDFSLGDE